MSKRWTLNILLLLFAFVLVFVIIFILYLYNIIPHRMYYAEDFNINTIHSSHDADQDGIDDYTDIMLGARAEIERNPTYHSAYYDGGFPPASEGVCTDVIWRSLRDAGYDLKQMMDVDIQHHVDVYPRVNGQPDSNIDFRRVPNVHVFLKRYTQELTLDLKQIEEWQLGDIVVFSDSHIGILSDKRNYKGIPYLLHNGGLPIQEEDALAREHFLKGIKGHYRFVLDQKEGTT